MDAPCACTTVRKASRALLRHYEKAFSGTDLSLIQFSVLRELERSGPTPLSKLAEVLVMERTSLYRTIQPLVESGAVEVTSGPNGRVKVARLTRKGGRRIAAAEPSWRRTQERVVDAIGEREWRAAAALLLAIPSLIEERAEPASRTSGRERR